MLRIKKNDINENKYKTKNLFDFININEFL